MIYGYSKIGGISVSYPYRIPIIVWYCCIRIFSVSLFLGGYPLSSKVLLLEQSEIQIQLFFSPITSLWVYSHLRNLVLLKIIAQNDILSSSPNELENASESSFGNHRWINFILFCYIYGAKVAALWVVTWLEVIDSNSEDSLSACNGKIRPHTSTISRPHQVGASFTEPPLYIYICLSVCSHSIIYTYTHDFRWFFHQTSDIKH